MNTTKNEEIKLFVKLKHLPFQFTHEYFLSLPDPVFAEFYKESVSKDVFVLHAGTEKEKLNRICTFIDIYELFNSQLVRTVFEKRIIRLCTEYYLKELDNGQH